MMRGKVWGPVAVVVALMVSAGATSRVDLKAWSVPVAGQPWLAAPSWPVPALRSHRFAWAGIERTAVVPSWPVRSLQLLEPNWLAAASAQATPAAGPIAHAARVRFVRAGLSLWLALLLAYAATWVPQVRVARRGQRHAMLAARVRLLAERGVDAGRIARRSGLPRDAVRGLVRSSVARRRA